MNFDLFGVPVKQRAMPHVSHNSGDSEWYTPAEYIEAARAVLGTIDLDPASSAVANEVVRAATFYTARDNGLSHHWSGKVWLNPPYAAGLCERFTDKLCYHFDAGHVTQAIVLVNNATETRWFGRLVESAAALVFTSVRVKYWRMDGINGKRNGPLQGQALIYLGLEREKFLAVFQPFGFGVIPTPHDTRPPMLFDL